jgi:hypothetical protein
MTAAMANGSSIDNNPKSKLVIAMPLVFGPFSTDSGRSAGCELIGDKRIGEPHLLQNCSESGFSARQLVQNMGIYVPR